MVKTETERNGMEFSLYRDDNQDGVWTQIAEGESHGNTALNIVELVGMAGGLAVADALVG